MGYRTWHSMVFQLTLRRHWIIFVSAGGEPQARLRASRPVRRIPAACAKVCARLTKSSDGVRAQRRRLAHEIS